MTTYRFTIDGRPQPAPGPLPRLLCAVRWALAAGARSVRLEEAGGRLVVAISTVPPPSTP